MAITPPKVQNIDVDVPLEEFGGLVTELTPADIPQGASPFAQDVDYQLGAVFTRAGLTAQFPAGAFGLNNANFLKSFSLPNTNDELLLLDGGGNFWYEDTTNNPGTLNLIGQVTPGSFSNSATQFGREWLAFNDSAWGFDIPRQWDGQFFDRVSQDGPGAPPVVADESVSNTLAGSPNGLLPLGQAAPYTISTITQIGNVCTVTLAAPTTVQLAPGDQFVIASAGVAGYDGTQTVSTGISLTQFQFIITTTGLGTSTGGTCSTGEVKVVSGTNFNVAMSSILIAGAGSSAYNGTWPLRIDAIGGTSVWIYINNFSLSASGGGTASSAGNITAGVHEVVQIFLTRQGYLTRPSPIGSWIAAGSKRAIVSLLAVGPSNIIARWIAFTGTGGAYFFVIPVPTTGSTTGTVVNDNSTTTFTVDFSDTTLLNAFSIDSAGNDLFNLDVLGPAAGVISYSNRMFWWGERNKIQNFLNMGFDGGFDLTGTYPLGWKVTTGTSGGSQQNPSQVFGFSYKLTSGGAAGVKYGSIEQSAYQDSFNVAILAPNTAYSVRFAASIAGGVNPPGSFIVEFYSPTAGSIATASLPIASLTLQSNYYSVAMSAVTPASIPSDAVLKIYIVNAQFGTVVLVDELEVFPTNVPYISTSLRASYNSNPESFDGVTGVIGVSNFDGKIIRACFVLRDTLYIVKDGSLYVTQDNGSTEPFGWTVSSVSTTIGTPSIRGVAVGEEYAFIVNQTGVYMFSGQEPIRINQEIKPVSGLGQGWDTINWAAGKNIWVTLDINNRHLLIGAPTGISTVPNQIFMMNYRELDESYAIASQKAVHMSYTGKMVSWDMSRKWAQWSISANCCAIVRRQNLSLQVWFGNNKTNGKVYYLDPTNGTDDGAAIPWGYFSFFFVNREMEQGLQVGCHGHIYTYLSFFASGTGVTSLSLYADSLTTSRIKQLAPRSLTQNPSWDREVPVNFSGDRVAIRFAPDGNPGTTFFLSKLTMTMKAHPYTPVRGIA